MSKKKQSRTRTDVQREKRQARAVARTLAVDELIKENAPLLWAKQSGAGITEDQVNSILDELGAELSTRQLAKRIELLRRRLRQLGRKTGGNVHLPLPAAVIEREPSPYRDNAMQSAVRLHRAHEEFLKDLSALAGGPEEPDLTLGEQERARLLRIEVGRILYSAVANGGLLEESLLWQLPKELAHQPIAHRDLAWVTFPLSKERAETPDKQPVRAPAVRRWYVDYVTLGLIVRLLLRHSGSAREKIAVVSGKESLSAYLNELQRKGSSGERLLINQKSGERSFFGAAAVRISFSTPPVVVRYLRELSMGESMSERSWWRYRFGRGAQSTPEVEEVPQADYERIGPEETTSAQLDDPSSFKGVNQQRMAGLLKWCLSRKKTGEKLPSSEAHRKVLSVIADHGNQMSPLVLSIFWWFEFILSSTARSEGPVRTVSARTYRSRIVQPMIDTNWEFDIRQEQPEEWEEFYGDVLMSITAPVQRQHASMTIRMFHQFLMAKVGAPPVMIAGELEEGLRTRNSILSENDFGALRDYLQSVPGNSYTCQLLEVIAILMFRAGLRPNDIVGLRFRHISGCSLNDFEQRTVYPVLYPRSTTQNTLKTSAAVRQIPLPWLIPQDELDVITDFLQKRLVCCQANKMNLASSTVFASDWNSNIKMKSARYFGHLSKLLKQITEDPEVSSYHLRHSFLSNWALKILTGGIKDPDHPMLRPECLPREIIYTLSTISAHESPETSLGTYIKTMDGVAFHFLQKRLVGLSDPVRAGIECLAPVTLKNRRAYNRVQGKGASKKKKKRLLPSKHEELQYGYEQLVQHLADVPPPFLDRRVYEGLPKELIDPSITDLELPELFRLAKYLAHHGEKSAGVAENIFSLPQKEIIGIRDHGQALGGVMTKPRSEKATSRTLRDQQPQEKPKGEASSEGKRPTWSANRRPGDIAPALPRDSEERREAERIYRLLINRAEKYRWNRGQIEEKIVSRVRQLIEHSALNERAVRTRSREEFQTLLETLKWLRIPAERIRLTVESMPRGSAHNLDEWHRQLIAWSPWKKIQTATLDKGDPRVSREHPKFGICLIQVLAVPESDSHSSLKAGTKKAMTSGKAAASWRVGCYYALIAIQTKLDSIRG